MTFDLKSFDVQKFDSILARGLCHGMGEQGSQVCIEAAICETLGLPHGDTPQCVSEAVRAFKIILNDSPWSSSKARAAGLRDLGIAQLGSKGVVDDVEFSKRLAEKTIRVLIPTLFREMFPNNAECLAAAERCELEGTEAIARAAADVARTAYAADAAAYAAYAAYAADAAEAAYAARTAAEVCDAVDKYLILSAKLALDVLREMKSPGVGLL